MIYSQPQVSVLYVHEKDHKYALFQPFLSHFGLIPVFVHLAFVYPYTAYYVYYQTPEACQVLKCG